MQLLEEIHSEVLSEVLTYSKVNNEVLEIYRHSLVYPKGDVLEDFSSQLMAMGVWERLKRDMLKREVEHLNSLYALYLARSKRERNKYTRKLWRARATEVHGRACALQREFKAIYGLI